MPFRTLSATVACTAALLTAGLLSPPPAGAATPGAAPTADHLPRVAAQRSSGVLSLRPALSQPGKRPTTSSSKTQALAVFRHTRAGRTIALQRADGAAWRTVGRARQHRSGSTVFTLPDTTGHYRAVVLSRSGSVRATTNTVRGRAFTTLFKDEFSGRRVDTSKWSDQPTLAPAYMRMCSTLSRRVRTVGDGVLNLGVAPDPTRADRPCTWQLNGRSGSHAYMWNTQLYTGGKFDFTYGYAAARIKMHLDKGMHASFWLQPSNWYTPGQPAKGTEIDVVEFFGRTSTDSTIGAFVHWYDTANEHRKLGGLFPYANTLKSAAETWSSAYHVFSVE